jgi:DtxR family Mn-dependent transcriptional regulator
MSWDRVHAEAEVLEHVLSEDLEQLIAARLGDPTVDPHGDPIPTVEFGIYEPAGRSLDELPLGASGRLVRVADDPEMLRYLAGLGIALGDRLEVVGRQPFGGPVFVRFGAREHPIGGALARAMRIETEEASG